VASGETNISPAALDDGKLIVVNMPVLKYKESGSFVQMVWKLLTQRYAMRRTLTPASRDLVGWYDEAQCHALPSVDSQVQAVARSHRLIQVAITQNVPLMVSTLKSKEDVQAWMSNLQTWFMFANGDKETNELCSARCGNSKHLFGGMSMNLTPYDAVADYMGLDDQHGNFSLHEHWHPDVPPESFVRLRKGGEANGFLVDCYVSQGGRVFSNRKPWIKATIKQMV
jgi:hypothetical protein